LAERAEGAAAGESLSPILVMIDDADFFLEDPAVANPLADLVLNGRDGAMTLIATASSFRTSHAYDTWIRAMRSAGYGLVLQPDGDKEEDIFDCRFPRGTATVFPPGRGYFIERSSVQLVQLAC